MMITFLKIFGNMFILNQTPDVGCGQEVNLVNVMEMVMGVIV